MALTVKLRNMTRSEVAKVNEIILQHALEMKKAIAHARAQEM